MQTIENKLVGQTKQKYLNLRQQRLNKVNLKVYSEIFGIECIVDE